MRFVALFSVLSFIAACSGETGREPDAPLADEPAVYVGMEVCRSCHMDKYETFIHTGMGMSYDSATKEKSSAEFDHAFLCDSYSSLCYKAYWNGDDLWMHEFRKEGGDTVHSRKQLINYIIGSGQHTNSHIYSVNGYLYQAPMTYYTQDGKWDLPPGFEKGNNTRFSRKIGLECMSCHNALPGLVMGSENKYSKVPNGIDCERCHGPGSGHVKKIQRGDITDTSKYADPSIVNPGKLSPDLQFDVCQRCHLQGNAVLKPGMSFYDFRPGMRLSDFWTVFLPKYENGEEDFIMASHADRLKMSNCFKKSATGSALTCVTCHNPHISVKQTGREVFNNACKKCHAPDDSCSEKKEVRVKKSDNCVSCHMPRSGSIDIPHVTVTDHFIRRPAAPGEKEKLKKFIGLYAINEESPPAVVRAKAYLYQYEKFEQAPYYLDSAKAILDAYVNKHDEFDTWVHYFFIRKDYPGIVALVSDMEKEIVLKTRLNRTSWDNLHAWTAYRIGEAFYQTGNTIWAERYLKKAVDLAGFNPEFRNKLGVAQLGLQKKEEARSSFQFITNENPNYAPGWCNLGYLELVSGNDQLAEKFYREAIKLDPDYEQAWLNMAGLYLYRKDRKGFDALMRTMIKKFPDSEKVRQLKVEMLKG